MEAAQILDKLAEVLAGKVRSPVPIDVALWDATDVAEYLRVGSTHVLTRYAPRPDFPKPIRLPTEGKRQGHPRWRAREIIDWAESYYDPIGKRRRQSSQ